MLLGRLALRTAAFALAAAACAGAAHAADMPITTVMNFSPGEVQSLGSPGNPFYRDQNFYFQLLDAHGVPVSLDLTGGSLNIPGGASVFFGCCVNEDGDFWGGGDSVGFTLESFDANTSLQASYTFFPGFFSVPQSQVTVVIPATGGGFEHFDSANLGFSIPEGIGAMFRANSGAGLSLDNITIASFTPEPSMWVLMTVGFGAIGWATRRLRTAPNGAYRPPS